MEQADVWPKISLDEVLNQVIKRQTFSEWNISDSSHRTKGSRKILGHIWVFDGFWPQYTQRMFNLSNPATCKTQLNLNAMHHKTNSSKNTRLVCNTTNAYWKKKTVYYVYFDCLLWLKSLKTILLSFVPSCLMSPNNLYRKMWIQITHKKLNNF